MKKILREVSPARLFRYVFYRLVTVGYRWLLFSPLQCALLRLCGATIGTNVVFETSTFYNYYVRGFRNLVIGNNVYIGPECIFDLANCIEIKDNVTLAARVNIVTHRNVGFKDHPLQQHLPRQDNSMVISEGAFIGTNTVILAGQHVGARTCIGAGALVNIPTDDDSLYVGVPLRKINDFTNRS